MTGSIDPIVGELKNLNKEGEIKINILHSEAGAISENDVMLAAASHGIVIGFNVQPDAVAKKKAEDEGVSIRCYNIIYRLTEDIEKALKGIFVARNPDEELPYIHKLVRLANLCGVTEELSEAQLSLLDTLNPLNIEARYPLNKTLLLQSLTQERCNTLIQETEALFQWLKMK